VRTEFCQPLLAIARGRVYDNGSQKEVVLAMKKFCLVNCLALEAAKNVVGRVMFRPENQGRGCEWRLLGWVGRIGGLIR
jgi:hypothetical protein